MDGFAGSFCGKMVEMRKGAADPYGRPVLYTIGKKREPGFPAQKKD
jgi:hypothetical protein